MPTHYDGTDDEERALTAYIRFARAFSTVDAQISQTFKAHDLTSGQFGVLETLYHLGPMHQGALGEKLLQSKGNISTIITNLEERDLAERRRDPEDRRYVKIHLTENGRQLIGDIFPEHVQQIVKALEALETDELETFSRLCKKLGVANA
ncbi:MAG: MarR family winged helix-turn-helix transcriptional regulator [Salinibacter sp.]|uniref:MarR family winged helix-turn-helix transcriptional regulator n=1 Tax=Salinibacter sp. TaxID=2065818 RepID=UPI002FC3615E